jgi:hypothetical protein
MDQIGTGSYSHSVGSEEANADFERRQQTFVAGQHLNRKPGRGLTGPFSHPLVPFVSCDSLTGP